MEEIINFDLPPERSSIIKVIGVGGGGNNAVNHMYCKGIKDVNFVVCNTDAQALQNSPVSIKLQLGEALTEGRGAGGKPEVGRQAALESADHIKEILSSNTSMVFVTAGMGGGTGTGAAPVIAKISRELGILTVAIVTIPFSFEGPERINQAIEGINELRHHVDSLLVINNEKLREIHGNLKVSEAFARADDVLATAAKGIAEIITVHGYINVDFADVETVMSDSGVAIMGSHNASGEDRAMKAIAGAIASPLLNNNEITGARSVLLNITSGTEEITMDEISEITDYVVNASSKDTTLIWGMGADKELGESISVTIIATGFKMNSIPELYIGKRRYDKFPLREAQKQKNSAGRLRSTMPDPNQGTIDFTVKNIEESEEYILFDEKRRNPDRDEKEKKMAERVRNLKESHEKLKESGYIPASRNDEIDEMENVPAYVRKRLELSNDMISDSDEVSKYRLSEDEETNGPKIKSDNSYLHDNVD
ncbi:MAG: cell division protein FtsZ [Bacteroidales bacterium]|nr:cell division protein FtsZ [Bacteroidales bacterium]MBN2699724.1 cell division protein FtsZ [Bacteroidales bacterium]